MKATRCIFHAACRFQQTLVANAAPAIPGHPPCWANHTGCDDEKEDMDVRCRLFERVKGEVMNQLRSCPICMGKGKLRISDYVERCIIPDAVINCPACEGLGVIRFPAQDAQRDPIVIDSRENSSEVAL